MLNHIHIIFQSDDCIAFIRDFKKRTSKELKANLQTTEPQVLRLFINSDEYHFWQPTNMPILLESEVVIRQKMDYIHNNPVRKEYVKRPQDWFWSSANPQCQLQISTE